MTIQFVMECFDVEENHLFACPASKLNRSVAPVDIRTTAVQQIDD